MAGHLVVQRLSRNLQLGNDLADVTLIPCQGLSDKLSFIGLNTSHQAFLWRAERFRLRNSDSDLAGVVRQLTQIARPIVFDQSSPHGVVNTWRVPAQSTGGTIQKAREQ